MEAHKLILHLSKMGLPELAALDILLDKRIATAIAEEQDAENTVCLSQRMRDIAKGRKHRAEALKEKYWKIARCVNDEVDSRLAFYGDLINAVEKTEPGDVH